MWTRGLINGYEKYTSDEILEYLRKSRSDDPSLSVEEVLLKHETILKEWAEKNLDAPIPEENVYREVVSGETIEGRPEVQKILKRMESPKIKAILVVEVQRLSRGDLEDCGRLIKLLRYTHTKVITPMKIYDLEDEYDRDAFERELKRGNDYLEYFKKIQKRGVQLSIQEGNYLGSVPPYGYNKIKVTVGKKKCPTLEINEDQAKVVRMIFDWYANERIGAQKICYRLNNMGIRNGSGEPWKSCTILKMLHNEHYIGKIAHGRRTTTHTVVNQEIVKGTKYNSEYNLYEGKHDAIIDEELFYRVQNKRASLPKSKPGTTLKNPFVSIFKCKCGGIMELHYHRNKFRYVCKNQNICHNSSVYLSDLTMAVCEQLKKHIDDFTIALNNTNDDEIEQHYEYISFLENKLKEVEKKEISLWDKYTDEGMPKSIFDKLRDKCEAEKENLETTLVKAYNEMPTKIDYNEKIIRFHETIEALNNESIPAEAKNRLLRSIIDRIEYSRLPAVRMTPEEAESKGIVTHNGWYVPDFELDIYLLI